MITCFFLFWGGVHDLVSFVLSHWPILLCSCLSFYFLCQLSLDTFKSWTIKNSSRSLELYTVTWQTFSSPFSCYTLPWMKHWAERWCVSVCVCVCFSGVVGCVLPQMRMTVRRSGCVRAAAVVRLNGFISRVFSAGLMRNRGATAPHVSPAHNAMLNTLSCSLSLVWQLMCQFTFLKMCLGSRFNIRSQLYKIYKLIFLI